MPLNLNELLQSATVSTPEESARYFSDPKDFRWSETLQGEDSPTGQPLIHINDRKRPDAPEGYRDKAAMSESIHLYKNVYPEEYEGMLAEARTDPNFDRWLRDSYDRDRIEHGEQRPFEKWVRQSRFDQIIGGYLYAQDPDFPTMKNWSRKDLPFGAPLTKRLEEIRRLNNLP